MVNRALNHEFNRFLRAHSMGPGGLGGDIVLFVTDMIITPQTEFGGYTNSVSRIRSGSSTGM